MKPKNKSKHIPAYQCQVKHSQISSAKPDFLKLFDGIDVDFSSANQIIKSSLRSESLLELGQLIRVDYQLINELKHIYRNMRFSVDLENCILVRSSEQGTWEYLHFVKQYKFDAQSDWQSSDASDYSSIELLLNSPRELLHRFDKSEFNSRILEQLLLDKSSYFEHFVHNKGGIIFSASEGYTYTGCDICYLSHGASIISYCIEKDISSRFLSHVYQNLGYSTALNYQVKNQVDQQILVPAIYMDPLTGLPNQRGFLRIVRQAIELGAKDIYVIIFSIDNFNYFCGIFSKAVQLQFLNRIITLLQLKTKNETLSYLGGSEFSYFLSATTESAVNEEIQSVLSVFANELSIDKHKIKFNFSVGYSCYNVEDQDNLPGTSQAADFLLNLAEIALFQATDSNQLQVMGFKPGMDDELKLQIDLMRGLRKALTAKEFVVYFQPISSSETEDTYEYFEALIRWQHPKHGLIGPDNFIQLAEKSGDIIPLGYWMIEKVCTYMAKPTSSKKVKISINLSPVQLNDPALLEKINAIFQRYGISPERIVFELTETAAMQNVALSQLKFKQLQELGFKLAVDDFGTGHSALSYLLDFSLEVLKIDKRFIDNTLENPRYAVIAESIISLAHSLSMAVVCEGIETKAQLDMVKLWGADFIQGYYICKPKPWSEFYPETAKN